MWDAILNNCTIKLENKPISKEIVIEKYENFLSHMIKSDGHNVGVVLYTDSICFDAVSVVYSAIANLLECEIDARKLIEQLEPGDYVLYGASTRKRYSFDGISVGKNHD